MCFPVSVKGSKPGHAPDLLWLLWLHWELQLQLFCEWEGGAGYKCSCGVELGRGEQRGGLGDSLSAHGFHLLCGGPAACDPQEDPPFHTARLLRSAGRLQRQSPAAAPPAWAAETSRKLLRVTGCLVRAAEDLLMSSLPRLFTVKLLESRFISLWDFPASLTRDYCGLLLPPSPQHKTSGRGPSLVLRSVYAQWCSLSCGGLEFRLVWK